MRYKTVDILFVNQPAVNPQYEQWYAAATVPLRWCGCKRHCLPLLALSNGVLGVWYGTAGRPRKKLVLRYGTRGGWGYVPLCVMAGVPGPFYLPVGEDATEKMRPFPGPPPPPALNWLKWASERLFIEYSHGGRQPPSRFTSILAYIDGHANTQIGTRRRHFNQ